MRSSSRNVRKASQDRIDAARALGEDLRKSHLLFADMAKVPRLSALGAADVSPVPLALVSRGGVIVSAGDALQRLFEVPPAEVLHKPLLNLIAPADHARFFRMLTTCLQSGATERAQFSMGLPGAPRKEVLLVIARVVPFHPAAAFRAAFVEVNQIEPNEFAQRQPQQDVRLVEAIDGIVWEADYPKRFTFVSRQAQRILGFSPETWMRDPEFWQKHLHHEDRDRIVQARLEAARKPANHALEYRMICADRRTVWIKDSAIILAAAPGWTRMCGIMTDVTDLQLARDELSRANEHLEAAVAERTAKMEQSLDAMETLCYGIAHDLKAPIRGLQGFIGILSTDYEKVFDDTARLYTQRCQAALTRMGELIEAVLTYGRLNHTIPELIPVRLGPLIDRILRPLEPDITAKGAKIAVQMSFPPVLGNPYLLEQVFTNLISNALKFSEPNTAPEISISAVEVPQKGSTGDWPAVRVTITDNGIGIPREAAQRMFGMFQKFHNAKEYPGTGIGLAVVKRAVELMNGRLGLFSEPNHGSSFWFELPSVSP